MSFDEDILALGDETLASRGMQVQIDTVFFFRQASFSLFHVLCDRVCPDVLFRFRLIEEFGGGEERFLECFSVDLEVLPVRVCLVETKGDCEVRESPAPGSDWNSKVVTSRDWGNQAHRKSR
jgi:hypothetical protein